MPRTAQSGRGPLPGYENLNEPQRGVTIFISKVLSHSAGKHRRETLSC